MAGSRDARRRWPGSPRARLGSAADVGDDLRRVRGSAALSAPTPEHRLPRNRSVRSASIGWNSLLVVLRVRISTVARGVGQLGLAKGTDTVEAWSPATQPPLDGFSRSSLRSDDDGALDQRQASSYGPRGEQHLGLRWLRAETDGTPDLAGQTSPSSRDGAGAFRSRACDRESPRRARQAHRRGRLAALRHRSTARGVLGGGEPATLVDLLHVQLSCHDQGADIDTTVRRVDPAASSAWRPMAGDHLRRCARCKPRRC